MTGRRIVIAAAVTLAVVGGGFAVTALNASGGSEAPRQSALPPATATVERGDLSNSTQFAGRLHYAKERKFNAGVAGTLTWAADTGSTVKRDGKLYEVNGKPVRLMYGTSPMYRTLKPGDKGRDVEQLEQNLAALGYTGFTVDDEYSSLTAAAVERWQKAHDLDGTGRAGPEQVAFAPSPVRIKSKDTAVGGRAGPGQPVLTTTGSEQVVSFKMDVAEAELAKAGTKVSIGMPDGSSAKGEVSSVGETAESGDDPQDTSPKVSVTVTFDEPKKVSSFDQSPVTVDVTGKIHKRVLSVPVNALLALPRGGFGVEVVENGKSREVKVDLGMFGQGRVEVSGGGLRDGMKVGVPKI